MSTLTTPSKTVASKAAISKQQSAKSPTVDANAPVVTISSTGSAKIETMHGNKLTSRERKLFTELQKIVKDGLEGMFDAHLKVGKAMQEIRDKKLYREKFKTLEHYCLSVFNVAKSRSYELMRASEVVDDLSATAHFSVVPKNERQVRPLTLLKVPADRNTAWKRALEIAGADPVSEKIVRQAVDEVKAEAKKTDAPAETTLEEEEPDWKTEISQRFLDQGFEAVFEQPFAWPGTVADFKSKDSDRFVKLVEAEMDLNIAACAIRLVESHPDSIVVVNAYENSPTSVEVSDTGVITSSFSVPFNSIAQKLNALLEDDGSFYSATEDEASGKVIWTRLSTEELTALGLTKEVVAD